MPATLDIVPLRSLVAVADCGGFQRAAAQLHVSQAGVSQHVRRLEAAVGRPLVERHGRGSRLTQDGERLLVQARRILRLHDDTLRGFDVHQEQTLTVGCTEHAAAQLLPRLTTALGEVLPTHRLQFRIDRGYRLHDELAGGRLDLALLLDVDSADAVAVGDLELTWYAAPGWSQPSPPEPVGVVAFGAPCALRNRALETLHAHGIDATIGAEAIQLAGVQAAVGAGLGVALMATLGQTPDGLEPRPDLPRPDPIGLHVCRRRGLPAGVRDPVADVVRGLLEASRAAVRQPA